MNVNMVSLISRNVMIICDTIIMIYINILFLLFIIIIAKLKNEYVQQYVAI